LALVRDTDTRYTSNQEIPEVSRMEQHESLVVSNILALHRWRAPMDGIYISRRSSHDGLTE